MDKSKAKAVAKTQSKKMPKGGNRGSRASSLVARAGKVALDRAAMDYAALLSDPCDGPLVRPVMAGSGQGSIIRLRDTYTLAGSSVLTAGFFEYRPTTCTLVLAQGLNGATGVSATSVTGTAATYLSANAVQYRCIASCMKVFNLNPEQGRAGVLGVANAATGFFNVGNTNSAAIALAEIPDVFRAPEGVEIIWTPQAGDELFGSNVGGVMVGAYLGDVGVAGTAGAGYMIAVTSVYEIITKSFQGLVLSPSPPPSSATFEQVLRAVWRQHGGKTVRLLGNAVANMFLHRARGALPRIEL
jgi:hypothetical protein